jgi:hypothetical protein
MQHLCNPLTVDCIFSQKVWYNHFIKVGNKSLFTKKLFNVGVNFIKDFYNSNTRTLKNWDQFKYDFACKDNMYFSWLQIVNSIPISWKNIIKNDPGNALIDICYDQHLLLLTRQLTINNLSAREYYNQITTKLFVKPASETTIENRLNLDDIPWTKVYSLTGEITIDTYSRMFNYKINHNILFLNHSLTCMGLLDNSLCSFCHLNNETPIHLFSQCQIAIQIWNELKLFIQIIPLPDLTPQSAILGFIDLYDDRILTNHLLLIFKITLYKYRDRGVYSIAHVLSNIKKSKVH